MQSILMSVPDAQVGSEVQQSMASRIQAEGG